MSAIMYASRVTCDYPGCQNTADVTMDEGTYQTYVRPDGWLSMTGNRAINVMTPFGLNVSDLCPLHASTPIDKLAAAFELGKRPDGNGN
jgi:hypothetical protein